MFRHPREVTPDAAISELGRILEPLPVLPWGAPALAHLGVPIVLGVSSLCLLLSLHYNDKCGDSSTLADYVRRFTDLHYCGPRRRLSGGNPKTTRLAVCLYSS